jgi:hypothetical protein
VPGCIAATPVEAPIDIEEGFSLEMPLVYFFGHASPQDNPELYLVRGYIHTDWYAGFVGGTSFGCCAELRVLRPGQA